MTKTFGGIISSSGKGATLFPNEAAGGGGGLGINGVHVPGNVMKDVYGMGFGDLGPEATGDFCLPIWTTMDSELDAGLI